MAASGNWKRVRDIGSNTGKFSRIAAKYTDYVIAIDSDHLCVDHLYRALQEESVDNILPLRINMADASPGLNWRGLERKSLTERGMPDLV